MVNNLHCSRYNKDERCLSSIGIHESLSPLASKLDKIKFNGALTGDNPGVLKTAFLLAGKNSKRSTQKISEGTKIFEQHT